VDRTDNSVVSGQLGAALFPTNKLINKFKNYQRKTQLGALCDRQLRTSKSTAPVSMLANIMFPLANVIVLHSLHVHINVISM